MDKTTSISLVGVGGQGTLLTSEILARTAALAGLDVKKSEIHGMSQRGGSVISQVRFGRHVYSPIVPDGGSDILVSFERLEALRWRSLLKPDGSALVNAMDIVPVTVSSGLQPAVADEESKLRALYPKLLLIDAQALAVEVGNIRTANMVLAGALSRLTSFDDALWRQALKARLPAKLLDINLKAFDAGIRAATVP
jgi:indolepyruvate ferredoxin oxidoreductase beta subunit